MRCIYHCWKIVWSPTSQSATRKRRNLQPSTPSFWACAQAGAFRGSRSRIPPKRARLGAKRGKRKKSIRHASSFFRSTDEWSAFPQGPKRLSFLFHRARRILFSLARQRKENGGCIPRHAGTACRRPRPAGGQLPSPRRETLPPPARGRAHSRPFTGGQRCPHNHSLPQTPAERPASPGGFPPSGGTPPYSWPWTSGR